MTRDRPVVLALCDYYLPGYRAGGPIRTLQAIFEYLSDEFEFRVVTRDRDLGARSAYGGVSVMSWNAVGSAQVMYLAPDQVSTMSMRGLINGIDHDLLYINSFFSVAFGIRPVLWRHFGLIPRRPTVIAPRGEFAPGALRLHAGRKRAYIAATKALGLARGILWQASGTHESTDIRRALGHRTEVVIAPDLAIALPPTEANLVEKRRGHLRLMFVGRIAPMKNLDGALKLLKGVTGDIEFDVYGPIEDGTYWSHCQQLMAKLPSTIKVTYRGEVNPDRIGDVIGAHDLLFMPSLGENFGHVILEAMCNGRPVLISDRTRWRGLEAAGVGWDVPLEKPDRYRQVLAACVAMGEPEWHVMSEKATRFGSAFVEDPASREQNRLLFRSALGKHSAIGPASRLAG